MSQHFVPPNSCSIARALRVDALLPGPFRSTPWQNENINAMCESQRSAVLP